MATYALAIVGDQQLPGMDPYDPPTEQTALFDVRDIPREHKAQTLTVGTQLGMEANAMSDMTATLNRTADGYQRVDLHRENGGWTWDASSWGRIGENFYGTDILDSERTYPTAAEALLAATLAVAAFNASWDAPCPPST